MKNSHQTVLSFFLSMICTALIMVGLSSCEQNPTVTLTRDEFNRLSNTSVPEPFSFTPNSNATKSYDWEIIKGSDGHEYIETVTGSLVIMHSPECKLCKSQQKFYLLDDHNHNNQNDTIK
jgi:hypothetical protein